MYIYISRHGPHGVQMCALDEHTDTQAPMGMQGVNSPGLTYMYVSPGSTGRSPNTNPWSGYQRKACHHKTP